MFSFFGLVFYHLPQAFLCLINIFSEMGGKCFSSAPWFSFSIFFPPDTNLLEAEEVRGSLFDSNKEVLLLQ